MIAQPKSVDLNRSYKGRYPFRLATTSFIYPDTWVANVQRLGPYLDEIELLFFESGADNYPSPYEMRELVRLAEDLNLTYNIHLPTDIYLGHPDAAQRDRAVAVIREMAEVTTSLPVSAYILHAVWTEDTLAASKAAAWRERGRESLIRLLNAGIAASSLAIETLEYPLAWLDPVIFDLGLAVCLDLGHLWLNGMEPLAHFQTYRDQTRVIHLHGVENGRDHLTLERLDEDKRATVRRILSTFNGVVSLEVFSLDPLLSSLDALEDICPPEIFS